MQPNPFPFGTVLSNPFLFSNGDLSEASASVGFESSRVLFLVPFLLFQGQGGGMDLSKVGEKFLSSVRSARSLGLLPSTSDRPEVPARAAAAAAVARALASLPPHQRYGLPSSSEELSSIYGSVPCDQVVEELEEEFYEEDFDPVKHILEHIPPEENDLDYFEKQAALRLAQLDKVAESLSHHVMEHHEVMVKGMNLVRELERDLRIANVICMNGRRHLTSSMNEVSRDLVVNTNAKKKQALVDMLPILAELRHALYMQEQLESLVEEGNYCKAFQVLSEYLQLLDSFSEFSAIQEMSRGVEVWLAKTLQKLDSLLLGVCEEFKEESYLTVVDAYALIGDISGLAEKIQSFFMQEVLSETHTVLKSIVQQDQEIQAQNSRFTYSDLCLQIPESKFRDCLLRTLDVLYRLMCSYHQIMSFELEHKEESNYSLGPGEVQQIDSIGGGTSNHTDVPLAEHLSHPGSTNSDSHSQFDARNDGNGTSTSGSPWYQLRQEAISFVSQTLQRGQRNLWQLTTSRVSVLLSSVAVSSTSIYQFLKNYEDLNVFILAGEAFCGVEAVEFRQKVKVVCENYYTSLHRQSVHALRMVLERESWQKLPPDTVQVVSFAGLLGDGAALIVSSDGKSTNSRLHQSDHLGNLVDVTSRKNGFSRWLESGNPFSQKGSQGHSSNGNLRGDHESPKSACSVISPRDLNYVNGTRTPASEDENEDLLADFIDEDSQLPSRLSKPAFSQRNYSNWKNDEIMAQTGSSLCLLRSMDKYARLMQKLENVNVELFKGICQLFEVFFYYVYEIFCQQNNNASGKGPPDTCNNRLKTAISRITQDCDHLLKSQLSAFPTSPPRTLGEVTPASPPSHSLTTSFGLKERCVGADTILVVSRVLLRSKAHLHSMLLRNNPAIVENFYTHVVDSVPDLIEHIHRTTARDLLHIDSYVDRIANAKWEVKELGLEHNGYVDLLLGEFKHYKTRLVHGGISKEVQDTLLEYGLEIVAETLTEGLSRVKRCSDEGRALMSLDLQVLINGLQHFVSVNVKPKLQMVETFIKAYYLPETEFVHWSHAHPEYSKHQIVGLVNLVAAMKGWKRKTRLEVIEKIES